MDAKSVKNLGVMGMTVKLRQIPNTMIPTDVAEKIGDRPIYDIELGDVTKFSGKLTISVKYTLKPDEKASDIAIWYLKDHGGYDRIKATYDDGMVTFETNHLSYYAVVNDPATGGGGSNTGLIVAIAIIVIILGILIFLYIFKRDLLFSLLPGKLRGN